MRTIIIIIIALICTSCKVQVITNYKIVTKERNYYTDKITYINDSIMFYEKDRKGLPKNAFIIPFQGAEIIPSN